jgi:large subunit ribosomal protein L24
MKLAQGDSVIVIAGKDKGKTGTVMRVLHDQNRVIVSGVNMVTKHVKKTVQSEGKIVKYEVSISASNVMIADPKTGKPSRIGFKVDAKGKKVRIAKKSGSTITRSKVDPAKADAAGKKSPFWKKGGFGADAAADGSSAKTEGGGSTPVTHTRSAGRGS